MTLSQMSPDRRCYAPATERNRDPIYQVLAQHLPPNGTVLEIASGTGQHAVYLAPRLAPRHWLPSDPSPTARESIAAWQAVAPCATLHPPLALDVMDGGWVEAVQQWHAAQAGTVPPVSAVVNINMIHIAPWAACEGLMAGAAALLPAEGLLYLYGPFMRAGRHTAPSNAAFDESLRSQDPAWGVRAMEAVIDLAAQHGWEFQQAIAMPANNFSVIFKRAK